MTEDKRAAWRVPPRRFGPIEGDEPAWLLLLEATAPWGCAIVAVATLTIAAMAFGVDYAAGHLIVRLF